MFDIEAYRAQNERERKALDAAVAALTPSQRGYWARVWAYHEAFDGEWASAHATLDRMRRNRELTDAGTRRYYRDEY